MLRLTVVLLLVANLGYYAWSAGWLQGLGMAPASPGEPARLQQQVSPQALRLPGEGAGAAAEPEPHAPAPGAAPPEEAATPPEGPAALEAPAAPAATPAAAAADEPQPPQASQAEAPLPAPAPAPAPAPVPTQTSAPPPAAPQAQQATPPAPSAPSAPPATSAAAPQPAAAALAQPAAPEPRRAGVCLQAGVFDARQAEALRTALASWPRGSWTLDATPVPGRWMIYMGRYADEEATARKRAELRALGVAYDRPGAAYEPGLALGRFSSEEGAQRGLALLGRQGVRSARIVQVRAEATGHTLRLPALDGALLARVPALRPALGGKELRSCR